MGELGKERRRDTVEIPEQLPERREIPQEAPATPVPEREKVKAPS